MRDLPALSLYSICAFGAVGLLAGLLGLLLRRRPGEDDLGCAGRLGRGGDPPGDRGGNDESGPADGPHEAVSFLGGVTSTSS